MDSHRSSVSVPLGRVHLMLMTSTRTLIALMATTIFTAYRFRIRTKYGWRITSQASWSSRFGIVNTKELVSFNYPIDTSRHKSKDAGQILKRTLKVKEKSSRISSS